LARCSPTPLLMLVAEHDHIAVTDVALKAYANALEPKRLVMLKGGHFDPYVGRVTGRHRLVQRPPLIESQEKHDVICSRHDRPA